MFRGLKAIVVTALLGCALFNTSPAFAQHNTFSLEVEPSVGTSDAFPKVPIKAVRKIKCGGGHGTGVVVGKDTLLTANHVIEGQSRCYDEESGETLTVVYADAASDYAVLKFTTTKQSQWLKISCDGFTTDETYYSFGFAGVGASDILMTRLRATEEFVDGHDQRSRSPFTHMRALLGVVIPGMSGGPIVDDKGRVVGLNNLTAGGFHYGLSRELKDTYFCKSKKRR